MRKTNLANVAVLLVESFSFDSEKIDFCIKIATLSILFFSGSQVDFPIFHIAFIIANSTTLMKTTLSGVSSIKRVYSQLSDSSIE